MKRIGRLGLGLGRRSNSNKACDCTTSTEPMPRIKPHASHIFIRTRSRPESWPPYPASPSPEFDAHLVRFKQEKRVLWNYVYTPDPADRTDPTDPADSAHLDTTSSNFDKEIVSGSTDDCLVFPDGIKSTVGDVIEDRMVGEKVVGAQVFICGHGTRDSRCGLASRRLVSTIESFMAAGTGNVHVTTHLGGHKFAGLLIIHVPPTIPSSTIPPSTTTGGKIEKDITTGKIDDKWSCVWYGKVTPDNVHHILDSTINKRTVVREFARYTSGQFDAP